MGSVLAIAFLPRVDSVAGITSSRPTSRGAYLQSLNSDDQGIHLGSRHRGSTQSQSWGV